MEGESSEFQDWEVLNHGSGSVTARSDSEEAAMEGDSEGMIRADYFSIDSHERYAETVSGVDLIEEGSVESDNPSWVDPGSERKISGELWSDERKFSDSDVKTELGTVGVVEMESGVGVDGIGDELGKGDVNSRMFDANRELSLVENDKSDVGFGEVMSQDNDLGRFWSNGNDVTVSMKFGDVLQQSEMGFGDYDAGEDGLGNSVGLEGGNISKMEQSSEKGSDDSEIVEMKPNTDPVSVGDKRMVVWWRVPIEFLKYYAFRVSPVWSFSVAAALMGFIILGRRLSRMKRKAQGLQLKVTVDEKNVSLFKSRAARLNEAFSLVKRVPIIRPAHPAPGLASWPMMSLR